MSIVYVQIINSNRKEKKLMTKFYDNDRNKVKTTHFGAKGMSDYTNFKDNEREERKKLYLARHKSNEDWNDYTTAGALSRWLLWHKQSLSASFNDYLKRFNLKKY